MNKLYFTGYDNDSRPMSRRPAGTISFPSEETSLAKAAGGASLKLGYRFDLYPDLHVAVSNVSGEIGFQGKRSHVDLGVGIDPESYVVHTGYKFPLGEFPLGEPNRTIKGSLRLPINFAALEAVECLRAGDPARFSVILHGSALVFDKQTKAFDPCYLQVDGSSGTSVQVCTARDHWVPQVRNVSPMGSVLVEIPLAVDRPEPWDKVWKQLESASVNLAQGGESGWKNCVVEVRQALEEWKTIDGQQFGASKEDREKDKQQRLNDIAKALFHYCSLAVHSDEHRSAWTRADATLALSALSALLSSRNP